FVMMVAGVLVAFTLHLVPDSVVARLNDFTQEFTGFDVRGAGITASNYAVLERLAHWQAAVRMANDYPWLGVGLGSYSAAYPRYALMNWPLALDHAHNYYLNILAETGVVGLAGYSAAVIGVALLIVRAYNSAANHSRALIVGILGAWIGLSVHNLFDMLYV